MHSRTRIASLMVTALAVALLSVALPCDEAAAHGEEHAIGGHILKMTSPLDVWKRKFIFKAKKQLQINEVSEDLTQATTAVIVRGSGDNAGATGVVHLDPSGWKRIGKPDAIKGWKYKADYKDPGSGGVYKALIKKGRNGGKMLVKAKGVAWTYSITGPQDSVEISVTLGDEHYCADFVAGTAEFKKNESRLLMAKGAPAPSSCNAVCGNDRLELGETCDDGDSNDMNGCSNQCEGSQCDSDDYASTYEAVQTLLFDSQAYQCSNAVCHGSDNPSGGLDLRAGNSWAALINVPSQIDPDTMRVLPAEQDWSMLYNKLAAKTFGEPTVPGSSMPPNASTVTSEHMELLKLWIRGGAPATGVVAGTAELLEACLPDPSPNEIPRPDPPAEGEGVQFRMPQYALGAQSETENCNVSYYDITDIVPDQYLIDCTGEFPGTNDHGAKAGKCLAQGYQYFTQDPQSHHAIINLYSGDSDYDDPAWGAWTCQGEDAANEACDPAAAAPCPGGGLCATQRVTGAACGGTPGPADFSGLGNIGFSGAQESVGIFQMPEGVYRPVPLKGIIAWNSHAFNLTNTPLWLDAYINVHYTDDAQFEATGGIFGVNRIFVQNVPPFEQREYCATFTFPQGSRLIEISSHTHRHGKHFRIWAPPQEECTGGNVLQADPGCEPGDPDDLFYESFGYSDARYIRYLDDPWLLQGNQAARTFRYCSLYDNGYDDPATVKRQSLSPSPPPGFGAIGGPCSDATVACMGGPNMGNLCLGSDWNCPESECDACPARGGLTTEDEMFLMLGFYYIDPE